MSIKDRIKFWQFKNEARKADGNSLKTLNLGKHKITFKKGEEVIHGYRELFRDGIYTFTSDVAKPLIIDCGAHIGMSVIFFKDLFPASSVIAFEPDEENFNLLTENSQQFSDITLEKKAIWVHNNGVSFSSTGDMSSHIDPGANREVSVPSARLYDYLDQPVDMLKIDIEGAEVDVLKDCKERLHNVKNMFVEFHGNVNEPEKLKDLLEVFRDVKIDYYIKPANDWAPYPFLNMESKNGWDVQLNIFCKYVKK